MADFAGGRLQLFGNQVQKRRFTAAVRTDDCDAVALENFHGEVGDQFRAFAISKVQFLDLQHALAGESCFGEAKVEVPFVGEAFASGKLCRGLNLGLHHGGLCGLVAESFDDLFQLGLLFCLVFLCALGDFFFFGNRLAELFYGAFDLAHLVAVNAHCVGADLVHKMVVVGNQKDFALPAAQKAAEPAHRHNIQVVGRFVEQEHVGFRCQDLRQVQADLETA